MDESASPDLSSGFVLINEIVAKLTARQAATDNKKRQPKLPLMVDEVIVERKPQVVAVLGLASVGLLRAYFWRNLSTRPAVSTIFCLPV